MGFNPVERNNIRQAVNFSSKSHNVDGWQLDDKELTV